MTYSQGVVLLVAVLATVGTIAVPVGAAQGGSLTLSASVPSSATVGEPVPIDVTVEVPESAGNGSEPLTVKLLVDGTERSRITTDASGGDSRTVTFSPTFDSDGSRRITVVAAYETERRTMTQRVNARIDVEPAPLGSLDVDLDAPSTATAGEPTTVSATVSLPEAEDRDVSGEVTIELIADGESAGSKTVTLGDGGAETVSFEVTFDDAGSATVTIDASGTVGDESVSASANDRLTVEKAEPDIGPLELSVEAPDSATAGSPRTVDATVSLPVAADIDKAARITIVARVDGQEAASTTVDLAPGETKSTKLEVTFPEAGAAELTVEADGRLKGQTLEDSTSTTVQVEPAPEESLSLALDPPESATVDDPATVGVAVTFSGQGDEAVETTVRLDVDGETVEKRTVDLVPGTETSLSFEHTFEGTGSHDLTVVATTTGEDRTLRTKTSHRLTVKDGGGSGNNATAGNSSDSSQGTGSTAGNETSSNTTGGGAGGNTTTGGNTTAGGNTTTENNATAGNSSAAAGATGSGDNGTRTGQTDDSTPTPSGDDEPVSTPEGGVDTPSGTPSQGQGGGATTPAGSVGQSNATNGGAALGVGANGSSGRSNASGNRPNASEIGPNGAVGGPNGSLPGAAGARNGTGAVNGANTPGFGALAALVALLAVGVRVRGRRTGP